MRISGKRAGDVKMSIKEKKKTHHNLLGFYTKQLSHATAEMGVGCKETQLVYPHSLVNVRCFEMQKHELYKACVISAVMFLSSFCIKCG